MAMGYKKTLCSNRMCDGGAICGTTIKTDMMAMVTSGNEITMINILARIIKRECGTMIIATRTLISWVNYWNSAKATNITQVE